jgi:hypothetical protein
LWQTFILFARAKQKTKHLFYVFFAFALFISEGTATKKHNKMTMAATSPVLGSRTKLMYLGSELPPISECFPFAFFPTSPRASKKRGLLCDYGDSSNPQKRSKLG